MQVPDEIRRCTAFLAVPTHSLGERFLGTAFFVVEAPDSESGQGRKWVATANHSLKESEGYSSDARILLRVNTVTAAEWIGIERRRWISHSDPAVDLAMAEVTDEFDGTDALFYPLDMAMTPRQIRDWSVGVGDDVLITGLFRSHVNTSRNIPIVRAGTIAAMPEEPVTTDLGAVNAYLIESRSIGGLSGSPAFLSYGPVRINPSTGRFHPLRRPEFGLLGFLHGHYNFDGASESDSDEGTSDEAASMDALSSEQINSGIAIVIPAERLVELIDEISAARTTDDISGSDAVDVEAADAES